MHSQPSFLGDVFDSRVRAHLGKDMAGQWCPAKKTSNNYVGEFK
jgi:hypothetical protein